MKVLIATGLYPPEIGGPATYTVLLEKELHNRGVSVSVLPFSYSRRYPKLLRHIHFFIWTVIEARKVDVVFAQDVVSVGLPALLAAKLLQKKFFVRVPGDYAWEQATQRFSVKENIDDFQNQKYGFRVEFLRYVQHVVTRHADRVITPSEYFRELVTKWGVETTKISTIYNGVDLDIVPTTVIKPAPLTIVSAGRLVPWKGFKVLIETMRQLPAWHLVILGEGPQRQLLKKLIDELHLNDRVHLLGTVSRPDVFAWCKTADVFILNTHFESFSYQVVEAMYSGVPVVSTNIGSLPELLTSGEEGLLLSPDDSEGMIAAIKSVVTEKARWQRRSVNARQKATQFSIEQTVDALYKLLKS
jgi:glycosyltransferase involved in cell wall biosynthesis